jgi:hypothetical protein
MNEDGSLSTKEFQINGKIDTKWYATSIDDYTKTIREVMMVMNYSSWMIKLRHILM